MVPIVSRKHSLFRIFFRTYRHVLVLAILLCPTTKLSGQESPLEVKVTIESKKLSIYEALNLLSTKIGYNFVYDSKDIESDKKVKIEATNESVATILTRLLSNSELKAKIVDKYILIYREAERPQTAVTAKKDSVHLFAVRGHIYDKETKEPISYVPVGIASLGIGTISNIDGYFVLKVPSQKHNPIITFSHLGYKSEQIPATLLEGKQVDIYLESQSISIQEVIFRNVDPMAIVEKAMEQKAENYESNATYLTSFYREGVVKNKNILNYTEAIFKVYKSPYHRSPEMDQVKLLKSRKVKSEDQRDTLIVKMKAGINASLNLDIVKSTPDFLDAEYMSSYRYTKSDIVILDSLLVYAISFEQKKDIVEPFFKGILYIAMDNYAIIGADFEINPTYVAMSGRQLVVRKTWKTKVTPTSAVYSVRYKKWNGKYYLNHLRGDLNFKVRKRSRILSSDYHVFLEMAVIQIEKENVIRFEREEIVKSSAVFSDLDFSYDSDFWRDFNTIAPEMNLQELLQKIAPHVETLESSN